MNEAEQKAHNIKVNENMMRSPINNLEWIHRDRLEANDYNPNRVAPPELDLLEISILEDGWTQPIVKTPHPDAQDRFKIVDGFHRYTISGRPSLMELYDGMVPTVTLDPNKSRDALQMATIRHNRARGTHAALEMSNIVSEMITVHKLSMEVIMRLLQMEKEEVIRLANKAGIPKTEIIMETEFSKAWVPGEKTD